MGQLWSNESGSVKAYVLPGFIPNDPVSQSTALAIAQGARTPGELAAQTGVNIARYVFGLLVGAILFAIIWLVWFRPRGIPIPIRKAESFQPREETDESWLRLKQ